LPEDETMARCCLNYALGLAYWAKGELEASYRSLEDGIRLSKLPRNSFITIQASAALAHIRFAQGHMNSAAEACRETIQLGTDSDGKESSIVCYARLLLGEILYQWNSLDEAMDNITRAIRLSSKVSDRAIILNANMALARIAIARGESDAAIAIARRARITHEGDVGQRFPADVFMTRLWLMAGNSAAASDYAHIWSEFLSTPSGESTQVNPSACLIQHTTYNIQRGIYGSDIRDVWSEIPLLTLIRLRLAQGKLEGLFELLEDVCRDIESRGWTDILIEALILKALVLHAEGKLAHALRILGDVLAMTEKEGYVRAFVDEGLPMFQLLQRASSRGIAPLYVSRLLSAFNMPASNTPSQSERSKVKGLASLRRATGFGYMTEPLTEREIEVLELIAAGLANRDIAKKLAISLYTAKNHLHRIYQKLDVDGRARAAIRAHEIGLLKHTSPKVQ
jgi:LuxR family maltose regulon positive regulatory protein